MSELLKLDTKTLVEMVETAEAEMEKEARKVAAIRTELEQAQRLLRAYRFFAEWAQERPTPISDEAVLNCYDNRLQNESEK